MHPDRLGAANEAAEVLGVLYPVEGEEEGSLPTRHGAGEQVLGGGLGASLHDQGNTLVPIEPCQLADQGAFDLNNRDAEGSGMQDHLLKGVASLRHHQEADRFATGGESLLYRSTPRDDLVLWADHSGHLQGDRSSRGPLLRATGTKGRACRARAETTGTTMPAWAWGAGTEAAGARWSGALLVVHPCGPAKRQR